MRFSIITATKNNREGLLRTIDCVRNQTYKNIEHIIVDGGSIDGTVEAIKNEQLKIKNLSALSSNYKLLSISESDSGIYDAINKGIKLASGDVIGVLHSDDLYADENVITRYAECFERDSGSESGMTMQIDAVYSDLVYVKEKQQLTSKPPDEKVSDENKSSNLAILQSFNFEIVRYWKTKKYEFTSEPQKNRAIKHGWMPPHPTLFIRKEIFNKYGFYRTDMKIAADYEMILRLLYKIKINTYYLPITTYLMSTGGTSNKSLVNIIQKSKEDLRAMKLNGISFPAITLFYKNIIKVPQFLVRSL